MALVAKEADDTVGWIGSIASRLRGRIRPLHSALVRSPVLGFPVRERSEYTGKSPVKAMKMLTAVEYFYEERVGTGSEWALLFACQCLKGRYKEKGVKLFSTVSSDGTRGNGGN